MADDQWVEGYESGMEQGYAERDKTAKGAKKQRGAEVLAACIAELKKQRDRQDQFETREAGYAMAALSVAMDAISKLRPAASDLEALLREARQKAVSESLHYCIAMCMTYEHEQDGFDSLITHLRADEEKARASEGDQK